MDWLRLAFWESIFSLSNGLIGTRGSFEEPMPGTRSRAMSFMAGLYNTIPKGLPELPVLPDWLTTRIVLDGSVFDLRLGRLQQFTRRLDMRRGLLTREVLWRDPMGRTTQLTFARFLSLDDRHLAALRIRLTPVDWSGPVVFEAGVTDSTRPASTKASHWQRARMRSAPDGVSLIETRTRQTRRPLVVGAAWDARANDRPIAGEPIVRDGLAGQTCHFDAQQGHTYTFDRFVVFMTDAPKAGPPARHARQTAIAARNEGFDTLRDRHAAACAKMWDRIDVEIDGPADDQRAIRFNLFQLATLGPRPGDVASIGPKGLSGTHYLGHIFWDTEIYMLPFFTLTDPGCARTLLEYRCHTLDGARGKAKANGYRGAQYAWESADTGAEVCPRYLPDPGGGEPVRIWCGDLQDHITADVPYAIDQYVRATGDRGFLWDCGAEVFFETARFWVSRVTRNVAGRYEIRDVIGPDEHHIHVDNDAYTNYLAHWNLTAAADLYDHPAWSEDRREALMARLDLKPDEPKTWREVADKLVLLYDEKTGLVNQSDGFTDRPDVSPDLFRLRRRVALADVLGGELATEAQVLKQADVVLMQYLLEERFDRTSREVNFDYYEPRTSHDSSLSVSAHALAAARLDRLEQAWDYFRRAAYLDLDDLAGNTADGLHTANMGGVWLAIVFGFAGLSIRGDQPVATPRLPGNWKRLRFRILHRGRWYAIDCTPGGATIEPCPIAR